MHQSRKATNKCIECKKYLDCTYFQFYAMQSKLIKQFCSFKPHALRPRCPKLGVTLSTKVAHTELFVPQNFARYYNSRVLKSNIRKCNFTSSEGSCTAKPFVGRLILPSSASFHHVIAVALISSDT